MSRDLTLLLEDILESIESIEAYTRGMEADAFYEDELVQDGVVRRLLVIGEAAKGVQTRRGTSGRRFLGGRWRGCGTS